MNFANKVAIVTGAGGGLGAAYAKLLASKGASVVVNNRYSPNLKFQKADATVDGKFMHLNRGINEIVSNSSW